MLIEMNAKELEEARNITAHLLYQINACLVKADVHQVYTYRLAEILQAPKVKKYKDLPDIGELDLIHNIKENGKEWQRLIVKYGKS
ncbi:hypothetical protein L6252_03610 [Candidatus Parcubacteria bacterium]|nr:hypothetical protein [Candidatus Parcubacteria bacterium]